MILQLPLAATGCLVRPALQAEVRLKTLDCTVLQNLYPFPNIKQLNLSESAAVGVLSQSCYHIKFFSILLVCIPRTPGALSLLNCRLTRNRNKRLSMPSTNLCS